MPYGYLGQNLPNQTVSNSGVFSITDVAELQSQGKLGGSLELIHTENASAVSYVEFLESAGTFDTSYNVHFITFNNISVSTNLNDIEITLYENGVEETASVYQYAMQYGFDNGTFGESKSTGIAYLRATGSIGNATNELGQAYCYFYNLPDSSKYSFFTQQGYLRQQGTLSGFQFSGGVLPQASLVNGLKCKVSSGTFSGTIKLYGVKQI